LKISLPTASRQGRRQRGGFYFFSENFVPRALGISRRQRWFFYFFENNTVPSVRGKAIGKDGFSIF
jgi:hypothetical protein